MMKNIKRFSALSIIALFLVFFQSCDDTSETFTISTPTNPVLEAFSFSKLELDAVNTNNPAITLNWEESDYGVQAAVNYAIHIANDDVFTNPVIASSVTGRNNVTLSVSELNAAAGNAGLNPFEWANIYIKVVASLGTQGGESIESNINTLEVYPYFNYVFSDYFLVGNGVAPGWNNNNNNPPLFRDASDSNQFSYTGYFSNDNSDYNEGRFKVLETIGLWQPQWGVTDNEGSDDFKTEGGIAGNPGTQSNDPGRFGAENSGFYTFTINFASLKYTMNPYDASGKTSPASLTLKGSSTADVAMTALTFDGHIWYAKGVKLLPGEVEFVTDSGAKWGSTTSFSGIATDAGGPVPVIVEDDYDVWFNDLTGDYILIPLNL